MQLTKATLSERLVAIGNNHPEWGAPLTIEQYQERESTLKDACFGELDTWILVDDDQTESSAGVREIYGQLETYKRPMDVYQMDASGEVVVSTGSNYGVASVFVPVKYRGRGFGRLMMTKLKEELAKSDSSELLTSHLYSDVGPKFYQKLGWEIFSPRGLEIAVDRIDPGVAQGSAYPVLEGDLEKFHQDYAKYMEREAHKLVAENQNAYVCSLRSLTQNTIWFRARSAIFAKYLPQCQGIKFSHRPYGHVVKDSGEEESCFLYFHNFKDDTLFVTAHRCDSSVSAGILIAATVSEAKTCGLKKVEIWNPCSALTHGRDFDPDSVPRFEQFSSENWLSETVGGDLEIAAGMKLVLRKEESIPSLVSLRGMEESRRILWIGNEKMCWC